MKTLYDWHRRHYPLMEPQDAVKLAFQSLLGCGHLLAEESTVAARIAREEACLSPDASQPLTEPLGRDYVRLNLRRAMAEDIPPLWIARLMACSAGPARTREDVVQAVAALGDPRAEKIAHRLVDEPGWIPSHSDAYRQAYGPAYRVISRSCAAALPVLSGIAARPEDQRLLVCIDGPCASGKTTLARLLQQVLDAAVIPMDDFFLPHARKTAQRLSQPGGNADHERLVAQCLVPWTARQPIVYRPYDCHRDALGDEIAVPDRRITLVEGSYSLLPDIACHADLRVFLQISPGEQLQRIRLRNGEDGLATFVQRWIPLEQAYFAALQLPDEGCTVVSTGWQEV